MAMQRISYLRHLVDESYRIIRLTLKSFPRNQSALLFSGGKDSCVLLDLVQKVVREDGLTPPKLVTIDTGYNFEEIDEFIDSKSPRHDVRRYSVSIDIHKDPELANNRNAAQAVTLKRAIKDLNLQAVFGGARRDEDPARAKERIFSHRDSSGNWKPYNQRVEMYGMYTDLRLLDGEHFRVFPLSNWTEADVWEYIVRNDVTIPSLYYAHKREEYGDSLMRFRTVGDRIVTKPVFSSAKNNLEIYNEVVNAMVSERGATRLDDKALSLEERKMGGYF